MSTHSFNDYQIQTAIFCKHIWYVAHLKPAVSSASHLWTLLLVNPKNHFAHSRCPSLLRSLSTSSKGLWTYQAAELVSQKTQNWLSVVMNWTNRCAYTGMLYSEPILQNANKSEPFSARIQSWPSLYLGWKRVQTAIRNAACLWVNHRHIFHEQTESCIRWTCSESSPIFTQ